MHLGDSLTNYTYTQIQTYTTADSGTAWVWAEPGLTINAPYFLSLYQFHQGIAFNPNGIVIALGTNDAAYVAAGQKTLPQVKADVSVILNRYPNTPIQWIIPTNPAVTASGAKNLPLRWFAKQSPQRLPTETIHA